VKRVRDALAKTQQQFAQDLNCSLSAVQRYEQQQVLPGVGALRQRLATLAKQAGVSLD